VNTFSSPELRENQGAGNEWTRQHGYGVQFPERGWRTGPSRGATGTRLAAVIDRIAADVDELARARRAGT
jgi:hypothetical protein